MAPYSLQYEPVSFRAWIKHSSASYTDDSGANLDNAHHATHSTLPNVIVPSARAQAQVTVTPLSLRDWLLRVPPATLDPSLTLYGAAVHNAHVACCEVIIGGLLAALEDSTIRRPDALRAGAGLWEFRSKGLTDEEVQHVVFKAIAEWMGGIIKLSSADSDSSAMLERITSRGCLGLARDSSVLQDPRTVPMLTVLRSEAMRKIGEEDTDNAHSVGLMNRSMHLNATDMLHVLTTALFPPFRQLVYNKQSQTPRSQAPSKQEESFKTKASPLKPEPVEQDLSLTESPLVSAECTPGDQSHRSSSSLTSFAPTPPLSAKSDAAVVCEKQEYREAEQAAVELVQSQSSDCPSDDSCEIAEHAPLENLDDLTAVLPCQDDPEDAAEHPPISEQQSEAEVVTQTMPAVITQAEPEAYGDQEVCLSVAGEAPPPSLATAPSHASAASRTPKAALCTEALTEALQKLVNSGDVTDDNGDEIDVVGMLRKMALSSAGSLNSARSGSGAPEAPPAPPESVRSGAGTVERSGSIDVASLDSEEVQKLIERPEVVSVIEELAQKSAVVHAESLAQLKRMQEAVSVPAQPPPPPGPSPEQVKAMQQRRYQEQMQKQQMMYAFANMNMWQNQMNTAMMASMAPPQRNGNTGRKGMESFALFRNVASRHGMSNIANTPLKVGGQSQMPGAGFGQASVMNPSMMSPGMMAPGMMMSPPSVMHMNQRSRSSRSAMLPTGASGMLPSRSGALAYGQSVPLGCPGASLVAPTQIGATPMRHGQHAGMGSAGSSMMTPPLVLNKRPTSGGMMTGRSYGSSIKSSSRMMSRGSRTCRSGCMSSLPIPEA